MYIAFDSVDNACSARARINSYKTFQPAQAYFTPDPCAIPCASLSSKEAEMTLFMESESRPVFRPESFMPRAPKAMRGAGRGFGFPSFPRDLDAPRPLVHARRLDYEDTGSPPPTPMLRRAKPVDYSDLAPSKQAKPLVNLLEDDPVMDKEKPDEVGQQLHLV